MSEPVTWLITFLRLSACDDLFMQILFISSSRIEDSISSLAKWGQEF